MRPATARAIVVARQQRERVARKERRRTRARVVVGVTGLVLLGLVWTMPITLPRAMEAWHDYNERQWFQEEKAGNGCNPYTGYCGPEAFDEEWENIQP